VGIPGRRPDLPGRAEITGRAGVQRPVLGCERPVGSGRHRGAGTGRRDHDRRYGPPFNQTTGASQQIAGIKPAEIAKAIFGLTLPINTASDFVLAPVSQLAAPSNPAVAAAVSRYEAAGGDLSSGAAADEIASSQQMTWLSNYAKALSASSARVTPTSIAVQPGNYGPVPAIIAAELAIASNGSLDGYFQGSQQLSTNTYLGTMFFSDGTLWATIAQAQGVLGSQWGVMNELWNFPGQVWLGLYSGMYQIPALNPPSNHNLDLDVGLLMILSGFLLPMFLPWIPVINRIPRWIPLYKIIYRTYYASMPASRPPKPSQARHRRLRQTSRHHPDNAQLPWCRKDRRTPVRRRAGRRAAAGWVSWLPRRTGRRPAGGCR
jgi:hypothetical protein